MKRIFLFLFVATSVIAVTSIQNTGNVYYRMAGILSGDVSNSNSVPLGNGAWVPTNQWGGGTGTTFTGSNTVYNTWTDLGSGVWQLAPVTNGPNGTVLWRNTNEVKAASADSWQGYASAFALTNGWTAFLTAGALTPYLTIASAATTYLPLGNTNIFIGPGVSVSGFDVTIPIPSLGQVAAIGKTVTNNISMLNGMSIYLVAPNTSYSNRVYAFDLGVRVVATNIDDGGENVWELSNDTGIRPKWNGFSQWDTGNLDPSIYALRANTVTVNGDTQNVGDDPSFTVATTDSNAVVSIVNSTNTITLIRVAALEANLAHSNVNAGAGITIITNATSWTFSINPDVVLTNGGSYPTTSVGLLGGNLAANFLTNGDTRAVTVNGSVTVSNSLVVTGAMDATTYKSNGVTLAFLSNAGQIGGLTATNSGSAGQTWFSGSGGTTGYLGNAASSGTGGITNMWQFGGSTIYTSDTLNVVAQTGIAGTLSNVSGVATLYLSNTVSASGGSGYTSAVNTNAGVAGQVWSNSTQLIVSTNGVLASGQWTNVANISGSAIGTNQSFGNPAFWVGSVTLSATAGNTASGRVIIVELDTGRTNPPALPLRYDNGAAINAGSVTYSFAVPVGTNSSYRLVQDAGTVALVTNALMTGIAGSQGAQGPAGSGSSGGTVTLWSTNLTAITSANITTTNMVLTNFYKVVISFNLFATNAATVLPYFKVNGLGTSIYYRDLVANAVVGGSSMITNYQLAAINTNGGWGDLVLFNPGDSLPVNKNVGGWFHRVTTVASADASQIADLTGQIQNPGVISNFTLGVETGAFTNGTTWSIIGYPKQ